MFEKLFSLAEIVKFTLEEAQEYEEYLMAFRDLKNSIGTASEDDEGFGEEQQALKTAEIMMANGESDDIMVLFAGLTMEQVKELRKRWVYNNHLFIDAEYQG